MSTRTSPQPPTRRTAPRDTIDRHDPPLERAGVGRRAGDLLARSGSWGRANAFLVGLFIVTSAVFFLGVWFVGELYEAIHNAAGVTRLDEAVQSWALHHRTPALSSAIAFYSNTGGPVLQPIVTGIVVVLLCWRWRSWTPLVLVVLAEAAAIAMTVAGKKLIGRARPPLPDSVPPYEYSASFPSGHTLNATVIAVILAYLFMHRFRGTAARIAIATTAFLYATTMGLSRVYLGHHWITDVFAGWALSTMWGLIVILAHQLWLAARRRLRPERWDALATDSG